MTEDMLFRIYSRRETVFTVNEIAQLLPGISYESLRDRLYYFTKIGKLKRIHQGIYAKEKYDTYELANKVYRPSYISLETVLAKGGIIFQHYDQVFAISYITRAVIIDKNKIQYRQIKKDVLVNTQGLEQKTGYYMATLERAFLDAVFIYKDYYFDNLGSIDWEKAFDLKQIYKSKILDKRLNGYYKLYKEDYGKH